MSENPELPQPDLALRRPDRLVGRWSMEGNLVGSDEKNITGETTFRWLPGGFFLEQRVHIDFIGLEIDSLELIGYDRETDTFPSTVYSNFSPDPLPYQWDVQGDTVTITVSFAPVTTCNGRARPAGVWVGSEVLGMEGELLDPKDARTRVRDTPETRATSALRPFRS